MKQFNSNINRFILQSTRLGALSNTLTRIGQNSRALVANRIAYWSDILIICLLSPLLIALALIIMSMAVFGWVGIYWEIMFNINGTRFKRYVLHSDYALVNTIINALKLNAWLLIINVIQNHIRIVGPRIRTVDECDCSSRTTRRLLSVRPGIISSHQLKKSGNIAYGSETAVDIEYVNGRSLTGDLMILLRSIPANLFASVTGYKSSQIPLLGVRIDNISMRRAVNNIVRFASENAVRAISFVNADCLNIAVKNNKYKKTLERSTLVLADGVGVRLGAKFHGYKIRQNVNGTDMLPLLCEKLSGGGKKLYLLGGQSGIAEATATWIKSNFPKVEIAGYNSGYFSAADSSAIASRIKNSGADILLAAMGTPIQENWISDYQEQSGVKVAIGVGGLFDFYSGRISRAPEWMRELSLEWIYRFMQEPGRLWRRYLLGNAVFIYRIIADRLKGWIENNKTQEIIN